ncbi:MAG: hypothetical protein ACRDYW_10680 [Acidimicrobiales bacterium]
MTGVLSRTRRSALPWTSITLVALVGGVVGVITWLMEHGSYDIFAGIIVGMVLIAGSLPLLRRAADLEVDARMARLVWLAFACKLLAAIPRYMVAFGLYDGQADSSSYSDAGALLARQFRDGDFVIDIGRQVQGTGFIQIVTGVVYTFTGATSLGGFLVFSWLGFWGLYLFYRAFVRACPQGDHLRYAVLVFFLPSLLFWPSSIGKEAWMCLCLGVVAYGASRALTAARGGILLVALGLLGLGTVRPHVGALVAVSLFAAYVLRRSPRSATGLAPFAKLLGIVALGGVLVVAVGQLEQFLGVDAFDVESVEASLDEVTAQTGQGGSYVEGTSTDLSPSRFPRAFMNVMFRPYLWQATNAQALVAAAEALVLLVLFVTGWRRLLGAARAVLDTPYVILCGCYAVLFVYGFSSFANYGILVRQRVQMLPFFLVLLAMPAVGPGRHPERRSPPAAVSARSA